MANVKVLGDDSLRREGFSDGEIAAARGDGYVGDRNGVQYFRAQSEINIDLGDHKTHEVRLPNQMGDRD